MTASADTVVADTELAPSQRRALEDIVKVKVMEVDIPRQRIGLSMRLSDEPGQVRGGRPGESREPARGGARPDRGGNARPVPQGSRSAAPVAGSALADAFARARGK